MLTLELDELNWMELEGPISLSDGCHTNRDDNRVCLCVCVQLLEKEISFVLASLVFIDDAELLLRKSRIAFEFGLNIAHAATVGLDIWYLGPR